MPTPRLCSFRGILGPWQGCCPCAPKQDLCSSSASEAWFLLSEGLWATLGASAPGPTQGHSGKGVLPPVPPKPAISGVGKVGVGALSQLGAAAEPAASAPFLLPLCRFLGRGKKRSQGCAHSWDRQEVTARSAPSAGAPSTSPPVAPRLPPPPPNLQPSRRGRCGSAAPGPARAAPIAAFPAQPRTAAGRAPLPCGSATGGCSFPAGVGPEPGAGIASATTL